MIRQNNDNGSVNISASVYTDIVGTAATNCFGVTKLAKPGTPVIRAYNKADLVGLEGIPAGKEIVPISAKQGRGMEDLMKAIEDALGSALHHVIVTLPYSMGGMVDTLHNNAQVKSVDYTADGIEIETVLDDILYGRLRDYISLEL